MTAAVPPLLLRRLSRGQLFAFDALLAAAVALLGWYAAAASPTPPGPGWREPEWVSVVVGVLLGLPVALRRRRPTAAAWTVLAVAGAGVAAGVIPDYAGSAPAAAVGLVLYTVGASVPRSWSIVAALACVLGIAVAFASVGADPFGVALVAWMIGACWTVGRAIRERRAYAARSAEQATALAVGEERLRLTRELHDIVAHSMSVIAVKATIADHVADEHPQEMREALRVIASTSRDALGELRRALGALRTEAAVMAPAPGLGDLNELVAAGRSTGLAVELEVEGRRELPEGVGLAVFRIVQEALTNVVRHADATACRIDIDIGGESDDNVQIRVADNGSGFNVGRSTAEPGPSERERPAPPGTATPQVGQLRAGQARAGQARVGQGLIGMRERVALFGGELTAGPAPDGGWIVEATMRGGP